MIPVAVVCALIMPENLSTALMVFAISITIMFIGRVPFRFLMSYVGMAVVGCPSLCHGAEHVYREEQG